MTVVVEGVELDIVVVGRDWDVTDMMCFWVWFDGDGLIGFGGFITYGVQGVEAGIQ